MANFASLVLITGGQFTSGKFDEDEENERRRTTLVNK
jgi:hypothetical protein